MVLVPQIHNAQRFDCRLDHVPTVMRVFEACMALDAFAKTQPGLPGRRLMPGGGHPDWLARLRMPGVGALDDGAGGISAGPFDSMNLRPDGLGDSPAAVAHNQRRSLPPSARSRSG